MHAVVTIITATDKKTDIRDWSDPYADDVTSIHLPSPMALKFEMYCDKVILLTKKRYILVADGKVSYKGVMNARRDYCKYAKDTYAEAVRMVALGKDTV